MHLAELPFVRAAQAPDAVAVSDEARSLTSAEFAAEVEQRAGQLARHGLGEGDVLALVLGNSVDFVVLLFAAWRLGASVTPVNPALTATEAAHQLSDSTASVVVVAESSQAAVAPATAAGATVLSLDEIAKTAPAPLGEQSLDGSAIALLIYTSGSTGRPKGVILDHANLRAMCTMVTGAVALSPVDHCLLVLPLFHVNAIVVSVLSPLLAGAGVSIRARFEPAAFLTDLERTGATYFSAVPTIYAVLTTLPDDIRPDLSALRFAVCGAAPASVEVLAGFAKRYGVPLLEGYGLSEGTCASTINPIDGIRKPGTVGLVLPGQEVAVGAEDGSHLPVGEEGEVLIRGANVMRGYLNRPEETAATVVDGWLHTGDIGRLDEDGYLTLVDRVKDMIIRGGENIYPKEIENALHTHPAVLEAAVIGTPHPTLGEVPAAWVMLRPGAGAKAEELLDHVRPQLAKYKWPVSVDVVDALPRNPVGKIDKPALRRLVQA